MNLLFAAILDFLLNIPFGYWRAKEKRFSWQWFASIHFPIPFIIIIRYQFNLGFALYTYPIMLATFFVGQYLGKVLNRKFAKEITTSKNIFADLLRLYKTNK